MGRWFIIDSEDRFEEAVKVLFGQPQPRQVYRLIFLASLRAAPLNSQLFLKRRLGHSISYQFQHIFFIVEKLFYAKYEALKAFEIGCLKWLIWETLSFIAK